MAVGHGGAARLAHGATGRLAVGCRRGQGARRQLARTTGGSATGSACLRLGDRAIRGGLARLAGRTTGTCRFLPARQLVAPRGRVLQQAVTDDGTGQQNQEHEQHGPPTDVPLTRRWRMARRRHVMATVIGLTIHGYSPFQNPIQVHSQASQQPSTSSHASNERFAARPPSVNAASVSRPGLGLSYHICTHDGKSHIGSISRCRGGCPQGNPERCSSVDSRRSSWGSATQYLATDSPTPV